MQYGNINATPEVLRQAAELVRHYTSAQYQLMLDYFRAIRSLENEIQTLGYQDVQDQILHLCKEAEEQYSEGVRLCSLLIQKADILENNEDLRKSTATLSVRTESARLPADKIRPNRYAVTLQPITIRQAEDGSSVTVFDHPEKSVNDAVYGQGGCVLEQKRYAGTCGICATATLLRRAGLVVDEQTVLAAAVKHHLCDNTDDAHCAEAYRFRGGTSLADRSQIADIFALQLEPEVEIPLGELANKVEQGHGVIISVLAGEGFYNPNNMYCGTQGGHALVLNSVERDAATRKILAYYVIDSNGHNPATAGIRVLADVLENAYAAQGYRANVTADIIW